MSSRSRAPIASQIYSQDDVTYFVGSETVVKLKDSTRKLLSLIEEIQSKTRSKNFVPKDSGKILNNKFHSSYTVLTSVEDAIGAKALQKLEAQTKILGQIKIEDEDDDCSIYKRLTRKCICLNRLGYHDFMIHFNEDTKHYTSTIGEIIKNMRILKRFLYMGGEYTKNALTFLNEGLTNCSHTEKVEITQASSHADICNVFDEHSIVLVFIYWPSKRDITKDTLLEGLVTSLLNQLAQLEEGRRYLNFNSKITLDINKVLRKRASRVEYYTLDSLKTTLNLLNPPLGAHLNVNYYCKRLDEGFSHKTLNALVQYRQYMTMEEILTHLDLLNKTSTQDHGKVELTQHLPNLLHLFKQLLSKYDNSEINIVVTNILNNIVSKNMMKEIEPEIPKAVVIADTATEPIEMKNEMIQIPAVQKNKDTRKFNKSKLGLGSNKCSKHHTKKRKDRNRSTIIVVPIEKPNK